MPDDHQIACYRTADTEQQAAQPDGGPGSKIDKLQFDTKESTQRMTSQIPSFRSA